MPDRRGSEIIADHLVAEGVAHVFELCGHGTVGMLDTLRQRGDLTTVSVHHEAIAGFMADAYFRVSGRPAATLTSCGPGSAQIPVALASAMADGSAIYAITGNVPTEQFNRAPFQEAGAHFQADFTSVVRPYVKRSYQATRAEQLPHMLQHGFNEMMSGTPGPVHLDVPLNVFVETADVQAPHVSWAGSRDNHSSVATPQEVDLCIQMLKAARRPLLLVGSAAGEASAELTELSDRLGLPVAWTPDGKGCVDPRAPLHLGETGRNGSGPATYAARSADLIIAVAARFDDRASSSWLPGVTFSIPPTRLVQVENSATEIGRNFPVDLGILATPAAFVRQLLAAVATTDEAPRPGWQEWRTQLVEQRAIWSARLSELPEATTGMHPMELLTRVRQHFPEDGIALADVGVHHNWMVQAWPSYRPRTLLQSWGFAAMGFGMGGVLGAKLAAPDRPAMAIVGDGGFLMTSSAVATAVEYGIPVTWVVWNNRGYLSIRDIQRGFFGPGSEFKTDFRHRSGDLYSADHAAMAEAMGAVGMSVRHGDELSSALETAFDSGRPTVVDVLVDREVTPVTTGAWSLPPMYPDLTAFADPT